MKPRLLFFSLAMFVVFICLAATVQPGKKIRDYPNTATLNSNDAFVVEIGDGSTNKNIRYGQLRQIITNGISGGGGGGSGISRIEVQTNGTRVGLVTNINWAYGMTGSVSSTTARLGVDDSTANTIVSNGIASLVTTTSNGLVTLVTTTSNGLATFTLNTSNFLFAIDTLVSNGAVNFTLVTSNTLYSTAQGAGSNLVVVLSGTNTFVTMTSTNGTNFYKVSADAFSITNTFATTNYANSVASNLVVVLAGVNTSVSLTSTNGTNFYTVSAVNNGGFVSGITNINYSSTNVFVDLGQTNYAVWNITNTSGPVNLLFTNLTVGFNFTVFIDGENIDGGTSASNMITSYVWPHASVLAHWLGFQTNTWVTSNKVLGISGLIRKTNDVIISSRE